MTGKAREKSASQAVVTASKRGIAVSSKLNECTGFVIKLINLK